MGQTFDQEDVFPIIARLIESIHARQDDWITARQLASALLNDAEGRRAVEGARNQQNHGDRSAEAIASNMVAWFSQRITVGGTEWESRFQRERVDGVWAYKPLQR